MPRLPTRETHALENRSVLVRHVTKDTVAPAGSRLAAKLVAGVSFQPQPPVGVNGKSGFVGGTYEHRLNEDGSFAIRFPNSMGLDGIYHRDRFQVITDKDLYRPGNEWLEIYEVDNPVPIFVG